MNFHPVNSFFSYLVLVVTMSSVAHIGSLFVWQVLDPQDGTEPQLINPTEWRNDADETLGESLVTYPLFGEPPVAKKTPKKPKPIKKRKKVKQVAPKVTFKLKGILSGDKASFAIIEVGREQNVYAVGDSLSYLYIEKIAENYVLFDDDGVEHKIYVSEDSVSVGGGEKSEHSPNENPTSSAQPTEVKVVESAVLERDENALPTFVANLSSKEKSTLRQVKNTLRKNPLQVLGKVNAFPYRDNGKLVGYQVTPGSEKTLFKNVGLQSGDIILNANGQPLNEITNFTKGMELMEQLGRSTTLDLLINRRGVERRIYVSIE